MKIILLGYMTSGKTTVGKFLASRMYLPFIDLDAYIEEQEERSISAIFEEEGEIYFRLKEHEYLKILLAKDEDFILSLGGGTPCYASNMDVITNDKNAISIYLQTSISTIVNRLKLNREKRPLVANLDDEKLTEYVAKHLFERQYFYNKAAKKLKTDDKTIEEIVTELQILLH